MELSQSISYTLMSFSMIASTRRWKMRAPRTSERAKTFTCDR